MMQLVGRHSRLGLMGLLMALVGAALLLSAGPARAAPAGAAQGLSLFDQRCTSNGQVEATFVWSPSGQGNQWFDITGLQNFSQWSSKALPSNAYYTSWTLPSNINAYVRINTWTSQGWRTSDILQFRSINCASFTPPSNPNATVYDDFVRISWNRGQGNSFFCVDTAFTQADLLNLRGSWANWGCGTTGTSLDLTNLACDRLHYYRVWGTGPGGSGHSEVRTFESPSCAFSPPANLRASSLSSTALRFQWDRGVNNDFFCLDYALTQNDLVNLKGSWNHACTGASQVDVSGLQCGTSYYVRVWATGPSTGYTPIATVSTMCDFRAPDDLEADVIDADTVLFTWDERDDALWFCIDIAESKADLLAFDDTWRNFDCGGTDELHEVTSDYFECGETYYWRVYGYAGNRAGHSEVDSFTMNCP